LLSSLIQKSRLCLLNFSKPREHNFYTVVA
jgi:hypothetical protein